MSDNDDIPFNRAFALQPGIVDEPVPGVRRVLCANPSPFTFTGTVSYIVGRGQVAIIDPGPDDPVHLAAVLDAVRGETVTHILVTHTHKDHSPGAAYLKQVTGATVYAEGAHRASRPFYEHEKVSTESGADRASCPMSSSATATCSAARIGRWKRSPRPDTAPTICASPGASAN